MEQTEPQKGKAALTAAETAFLHERRLQKKLRTKMLEMQINSPVAAIMT
jgi:hypothetical protein